MNDFQAQKLVESVVYILNQTQGTDIYHIFKILYFAERQHLAQWGNRIISDDFFALKYGPVPTNLYNALKENAQENKLSKYLFSAISPQDDDAYNIWISKRLANLDYLSKAEVESLNKSIKENSNKSFNELKENSHDSAWQKAFESIDKRIKPENMALANGASQSMIDYIRENQEFEMMFS